MAFFPRNLLTWKYNKRSHIFLSDKNLIWLKNQFPFIYIVIVNVNLTLLKTGINKVCLFRNLLLAPGSWRCCVAFLSFLSSTHRLKLDVIQGKCLKNAKQIFPLGSPQLTTSSTSHLQISSSHCWFSSSPIASSAELSGQAPLACEYITFSFENKTRS